MDAENDQTVIREALAALCRIAADLVNDGEAPSHTITIRDERGDDVASLSLAVAVAVRRRDNRADDSVATGGASKRPRRAAGALPETRQR